MNECNLSSARVRYTLPKSARVLTSSQFNWVKRNGQRFSGKWILIEFCKSKGNHPTQLGITITKRYGKAHDRNRMKRIIREAYRLCRFDIPVGFQCVVKPKMSHGQHLILKTSDLISDFLLFIKFLKK